MLTVKICKVFADQIRSTRTETMAKEMGVPIRNFKHTRILKRTSIKAIAVCDCWQPPASVNHQILGPRPGSPNSPFLIQPTPYAYPTYFPPLASTWCGCIGIFYAFFCDFRLPNLQQRQKKLSRCSSQPNLPTMVLNLNNRRIGVLSSEACLDSLRHSAYPDLAIH